MTEVTWVLLQPSTLLIALFLLSALLLIAGRLRAGRALLVLTLLLGALPALFPLGPLLARPLENRVAMPPALPERVDGILVLGGAVRWQVSEARGQLNLSEAGERVVAGAALARRYPEARLVFTGLFAETVAGEFSPAWGPQRFFTGPEFAPGRVRYLGSARSTYEDALHSLEALAPRAGETWLLVTSALHMPRATSVFRALGWRVLPYPVDFLTTGRERLEFRPSLDVVGRLAELDHVVREWGALLVYQAIGRT